MDSSANLRVFAAALSDFRDSWVLLSEVLKDQLADTPSPVRDEVLAQVERQLMRLRESVSKDPECKSPMHTVLDGKRGQKRIPASGTIQVQRFAVDSLHSSHWPSGLGGQLYVDCFVNRSTRHGLIAAIRLQIPKSMYLRSLRKNLSFAGACQFLKCSHSGWPRKSVESVPL